MLCTSRAVWVGLLLGLVGVDAHTASAGARLTPADTALAAASFACDGTATNRLEVTVPSDGGEAHGVPPLFEVHVSVAGESGYIALTSSTPRVVVDDLEPDTTYDVAWRQRNCRQHEPLPLCAWGNASSLIKCRTAALARGQLLVRPPRTREAKAITIRATRAAAGDGSASSGVAASGARPQQLEVQVRPVGATSEAAWSTPIPMAIPGGSGSAAGGAAELVRRIDDGLVAGGLADGAAYEVRARLALVGAGVGGIGGAGADGRVASTAEHHDAAAPWSDVVVHRTASVAARGAVRATPLYRLSEFGAAGPDHLTNHNSGDSSAAAALIASNSGGEFGAVYFPNGPNETYVTEYCAIEDADADADEPSSYADYMSCLDFMGDNETRDALPRSLGGHAEGTGDPRVQPGLALICACATRLDRDIGLRNTSSCGVRGNVNACECGAGCPLSNVCPGSSASQLRIGRQLVCGARANESAAAAPPADEDGCAAARPDQMRVGYWYSTPAAGECAEGEPPGSAGCQWARMPRAYVTTIAALIELGINTTNPTTGYRAAELRANAAIVEAGVHGSFAGRCCGC